MYADVSAFFLDSYRTAEVIATNSAEGVTEAFMLENARRANANFGAQVGNLSPLIYEVLVYILCPFTNLYTNHAFGSCRAIQYTYWSSLWGTGRLPVCVCLCVSSCLSLFTLYVGRQFDLCGVLPHRQPRLLMVRWVSRTYVRTWMGTGFFSDGMGWDGTIPLGWDGMG